MATKKKKGPTKSGDAVDRLAEVLGQHFTARQAAVPTTDRKVGIRSISDNTIGIVSPIAGEPDIDLHADLPQFAGNPGRTAVLSYAAWMTIRKGPLMQRGEIMRDDSVLGESFTPGPPDRPDDIPPSWAINAILDPTAWIQERMGDDARLRADLAKITSDASLRRLRRVVDMYLADKEKSFGEDPERARKAVESLPAVYRMLDELITTRLEHGTV